ncbi:MAG: hypothetical protein HFG91_04630 [Acholeplasmatales bacterium]|nr:hypothetical protein [Acholeplasmatales bacterium]
MKNTIKKPKIYFLIALLVAIVSLLIITVFIIQAIRIEWENSIIAVLFLLLFFLSIYFIILYFKWKIVFEKDKIIIHKPFHFPKIYNKEEVTKTQKSFLWEFGALWYKGKKIAKISIYDVNSHLTGYIKWKK